MNENMNKISCVISSTQNSAGTE